MPLHCCTLKARLCLQPCRILQRTPLPSHLPDLCLHILAHAQSKGMVMGDPSKHGKDVLQGFLRTIYEFTGSPEHPNADAGKQQALLARAIKWHMRVAKVLGRHGHAVGGPFVRGMCIRF